MGEPILHGDVCYSCLKWDGKGNGVPRACKKCHGRYVGKQQALSSPPHPNDERLLDMLMKRAWGSLSLSAQLKTCPMCLKPCKSANGVGMHLRMTHNA